MEATTQVASNCNPSVSPRYGLPERALIPGNEPGYSVTGSDMQMKVPVVLFAAESGQNLTASMLINNTLRNILDDRQQMSPKLWIELEQRPDVTFRHHDHMLGPKPLNRWPKGQHMIRLDNNIDVDHTGNDLIAIPILFRHNTNPTGGPHLPGISSRRYPTPAAGEYRTEAIPLRHQSCAHLS
ncbi:hypothetical protein [Nocardia arthritidis]|uniref:hypothetical protein n=1 Tax=Nocardia arthritidis TaxID=228602 RepID=UPI001EEAA47E|nr:hypothetical protein [Nocardia arthritidis]